MENVDPMPPLVFSVDPKKDFVLGNVVDTMSHGPAVATICFAVGGMLIKGVPIDGERHLKWLRDRMRRLYSDAAVQAANEFEEDEAERFIGQLDKAAAAWAESDPDRSQEVDAGHAQRLTEFWDDQTGNAEYPLNFVCLSKVELTLPDGRTARFDAWRFPLTAVQGWTILETDPST